jgi:hypothetical protein
VFCLVLLWCHGSSWQTRGLCVFAWMIALQRFGSGALCGWFWVSRVRDRQQAVILCHVRALGHVVWRGRSFHSSCRLCPVDGFRQESGWQAWHSMAFVSCAQGPSVLLRL